MSKRDGQERATGDGLRPYEPVSDELVLAAVERAERHRSHEREGVMWEEIVGHLGFIRGSWTTRQLRPQVLALVAAGLVAGSRRQGFALWALTDSGREQLESHRRAGNEVVLPESPQHRKWRQTRDAVAGLIGELRAQAQRSSDDAVALLDTPRRVSSDSWLLLADRLDHTFRRLGQATYCLYEWVEPGDANADIDEYTNPGDEQLDRDARARLRSLRRYRRSNWKDRYAGEQPSGEQTPAGAVVTMSPEMLSELRGGLHSVLGGAAQGIAQTTARMGRERHPEWYTEHRERLQRTWALLDLIGWAEPHQPAAMRVDVRAHRQAVSEALEVRLLVTADEIEEAEAVDTERAIQGKPPKREATTRRVLALREFATAVKELTERT